MKIGKIYYEQLFPTGIYMNQRYGVEIVIEDGDLCSPNGDGTFTLTNSKDAASKAFERAKELTEETFKKLNPNAGEVHTYSEPPYGNVAEVQVESKQSATQRMLEAINACTSIEVLETFKRLVKNNSEFQNAYDQKLQSLQK